MNTNTPTPATPSGAHADGDLLFLQFAEGGSDVFWLADMASAQLRYVNPRFEQWWGVESAELLNQPGLWNKSVLAEDSSLLPMPFFADPPSAEPAVREYRIVDAQGQCRWIRDRRFYQRDEQGKTLRVGGIAEDVTEHKRIEAERDTQLNEEQAARREAEAKTASKDEFLSVVTHELRSPLNAMRGWAHVLRRAGPLNGLQEKALEAIDRNTQTQARLVDDLLDSQRILAGKLELQWGRTNLPVLVDDAVASLHDQRLSKRLNIEVLHDHTIDGVSVDVNRLRQAVVKLLSNAVKFSPEDGRIEVRTRRGPGTLSIDVKDGGIGLTPEQQWSIFERFMPADAASTRPQNSLGLGLPLMRQIMQLHGGNITVTSDGSGQGATFTITLRDQEAPVSELGEPHSAATLSALAGKRVVVVEDDPDGREILERLLQDAKVQWRSFDRAAGAYEHLAHATPEEQPDALISDIAMPEEDGHAFIQRVRAMEARLHRPRMVAMALTAFSRQEDRQRALEAGFDEHMGKPFDAQAVLQTLESALDKNAQGRLETVSM